MVQRGNPNLLKSIQSGAKRVSESRGISEDKIPNSSIPSMNMGMAEGGAYASLHRNVPTSQSTYLAASPNSRRPIVSESFGEKRLKDRLLESVETLGTTGEYFNATSSLLTLYAMGQLTEGVMNSLSREDINEIRGIVREFKGVLDSY